MGKDFLAALTICLALLFEPVDWKLYLDSQKELLSMLVFSIAKLMQATSLTWISNVSYNYEQAWNFLTFEMIVLYLGIHASFWPFFPFFTLCTMNRMSSLQLALMAVIDFLTR